MQFKICGASLIAALFLAACGEGKLAITDSTFRPKIVIQGTLIPRQPVQIKLRRNFPVNAVAEAGDIILQNAQATITDSTAGQQHQLLFDSRNGYYQAPQLAIQYGQTYLLDVSATIDGQQLQASARTRVPNQGLNILEEKSILGSRLYRQRDKQNRLQDFRVVFERSPGTDFYAVSVTALAADTAAFRQDTTIFIFENPYTPSSFNAGDVMEDFDQFKYTFYWVQNVPLEPGETDMDIFSFLTWFYGDYRAVVYAGDRNFKDFLATHGEVKEIDGNFHEPSFHIDGDGIGLFGSAVVDSASFEVLRPM